MRTLPQSRLGGSGDPVQQELLGIPTVPRKDSHPKSRLKDLGEKYGGQVRDDWMMFPDFFRLMMSYVNKTDFLSFSS